MTKHDFNIVLVLLALITAGTLAYQSLNAESGRPSNNCTLALYFSSFDGCNSSDAINIPPPFMNEGLRDTITPEHMEMFEIDNYMLDDTLHHRTGFSDEMTHRP